MMQSSEMGNSNCTYRKCIGIFCKAVVTSVTSAATSLPLLLLAAVVRMQAATLICQTCDRGRVALFVCVRILAEPQHQKLLANPSVGAGTILLQTLKSAGSV